MPLNVHIIWVTPGATSISSSVASKATSWTVPLAASGSSGSWACQPSAGMAAGSMVAEASAAAAVLPPPVEGWEVEPTTRIAIDMPASL